MVPTLTSSIIHLPKYVFWYHRPFHYFQIPVHSFNYVVRSGLMLFCDCKIGQLVWNFMLEYPYNPPFERVSTPIFCFSREARKSKRWLILSINDKWHYVQRVRCSPFSFLYILSKLASSVHALRIFAIQQAFVGLVFCYSSFQAPQSSSQVVHIEKRVAFRIFLPEHSSNQIFEK